MVDVRTIPLGGADFGGNPLPPQGQFYVPDQSAAGDFPDYAPSAPSLTQSAADDFPDYKPVKAPKREIGTGEAIWEGFKNSLSFGAAPAIAGLSEASGQTGDQMTQTDTDAALADPYGAGALGGADIAKPFVGAAKMLHEYFSDHPDASVKAAYERGRQDALQNEQAAQEQHPYAYFAGQLGGAAAMPIPGLGAGSIAARAGKGFLAGGIGGGLYGAGSSISEGKPASDVATDALTNAAIGGPTGALLHGIVGPRATGGVTPGQRAAQTAQDLGAPLPRGLASDSPAINATTSKLRSVPVLGSRISNAVDKVQEAAGEHIGGISGALGGTDRATADALARGGLKNVIEDNKADIDAAYTKLRGMIDPDAHFVMPRTQTALNAIKAARKTAGHANPSQGLEQFENVAKGTSFNGAQRARTDAREAGNAIVPHPGFNAADYNRLTRAMTADMLDMVGKASLLKPGANSNSPIRALKAFHDAEQTFKTLADQNDILHKLVQANGENSISSLLGAAREKGGNLRLLAQLRNTMQPRQFEQIGGTLLNELGNNESSGNFSLGKFVTAWNKLSDGAKSVLFSPQHRRDIEAIVGMGQHIKGALRESNTSHTAGALVLLDLARDAVVGAVAVGTGAVSGASMAATAPFAAAGVMFTHWLASPAKTASMRAWVNAYRGAISNPTPARNAAFVLATRNLANNLQIPVNDISRVIQNRLPAAAQQNDNSAGQ